jgi:hypothetical protein
VTASEELFEKFCVDNAIPYSRLYPDKHKTPDYKVRLNRQPVIIEIKELQPNKDESQAIRDLTDKGQTRCLSTTPGKRIRSKIEKAKHQIEQYTSGKYPGILILYDARPPFFDISPYFIKVAMYGFETIDVHVPSTLSEPIKFGTHRFGKNSKLRKDLHTYISSLGVLRKKAPVNQLHLDLYENRFADIPIPRTALTNYQNITLFELAPSDETTFADWRQVSKLQDDL